ncbi:MAG: helix-turn-helix domain-containing protein [Woeseiaceae bacterium]|nr:helix-turn-helix domain-containing protein [Woeseiaceae bacterium]
MLDLISILVAGFSIFSAAILFVTYAFLLQFPHKTWHSLLSGGLLVLSLSVIQLGHVAYFVNGDAPLDDPAYRLALFVVPPMFFFFSRSIIIPTRPLKPYLALHLLPLATPYLLPLEVALPILFLAGTAYSVWFAMLIYDLRERRRQFRFELFFFITLSIVAVFVLVLGFSIPFIDDRFFYLVYVNGIGLAYLLTISALITIPDLMGDLAEAGRIKYSASTLKGVDVDASLAKLQSLMNVEHAYRDENLGLASLAESMSLSSQQLSELVNTQMGVGFSRYVREQRVEAAKRLLESAPDQSILSISLEVGFKSQSNFYAAFKEIVGVAPGDYRKTLSRS